MTARSLRVVVAILASVLLLSSCKFDGAYDLPLPGGPVDADKNVIV